MPSIALSYIHVIALVLALAIDLINGETRDKVCPLHPVPLAWRIGTFLLRKLRRTFSHGVLLWILTVLPLMAIYGISIELALKYFKSILVLLVLLPCYSTLLKFTFSIKLLRWYYSTILENFTKDEAKARTLLQEIVRRDVFALTREEALSALIETYVESIVDGIAAPLFYYPLLGLPGAYLQRLANTMDSLVGYPYEPYKEIGKFSAHVDTILNLLPAIVISLLIVLMGKGSIRKFVNVLKSSSNVKSINARLVFSSIASCLDIRLEKPGEYVVNSGGRSPSLEVCRKVLKICDRVLLAYLCIIVIMCLCV